MLIASSMASTIESGLDERLDKSTSTKSTSSSAFSLASFADGSDGGPEVSTLAASFGLRGSGTDSSSMSLRREGLAA